MLIKFREKYSKFVAQTNLETFRRPIKTIYDLRRVDVFRPDVDVYRPDNKLNYILSLLQSIVYWALIKTGKLVFNLCLLFLVCNFIDAGITLFGFDYIYFETINEE